MRKFEILPHTSDLRLKVTADSIKGIFKSSLEGMGSIIKSNCFNVDANITLTEKINVISLDESALLIDFLSEILTLSHNKKAVYKIKNIEKLAPTKINAVIEGEKLDGFDEDIKAVTYTEAKIKKSKNGIFETIIVFDI